MIDERQSGSTPAASRGPIQRLRMALANLDESGLIPHPEVPTVLLSVVVASCVMLLWVLGSEQRQLAREANEPSAAVFWTTRPVADDIAAAVRLVAR